MKLKHGSRSIALHELHPGRGSALLLLHALYGSSEDWQQAGDAEALASWVGPVFALDFRGHGASDWIRGGWYNAEGCVADADLALAHIGTTAIAGTGLGAYVALLLAGTRAGEIPAALLLDGVGLAGGGAAPDFTNPREPWSGSRKLEPGIDPMLCCLEREVRPVDYAQAFVDRARRVLLAENTSTRPRLFPPWWEGLRAHAHTRIVRGDLGSNLETLASEAWSERSE